MATENGEWLRFQTDSDNPRVLVVSPRRYQRGVAQMLRYEFEDVVASIDDVEFALPRSATMGSGRLGRLARRLDRSHPGLGRLLTRRRPCPTRRYDLLVVAVQSLGRLELMAPWSVWRGLARVSVCLVDDAFRGQVTTQGHDLRSLRAFDIVYFGCEGTVDLAQQVSGRPCRHMLFSVDALAACPYPNPPERVIDVYAMGRRRPGIHRAMSRICRRRGWYYSFDTARSACATSRLEHRRQLLERIRRTRYFIVQPALVDCPDLLDGQEEIGYRYYEGTACGAVLIGDAVRCPSFARSFGWEDAVVSVRPDGSDLPAVIDALESDPDRVDRIRRTNVAQSLRLHDHAYRWADILSAAGLTPRPALLERVRRLHERAAMVAPSVTAAPAAVQAAI